jgi:hypothetical protein
MDTKLRLIEIEKSSYASLALTQSSDESTSNHNHIGNHPNTANRIYKGRGKVRGRGFVELLQVEEVGEAWTWRQ